MAAAGGGQLDPFVGAQSGATVQISADNRVGETNGSASRRAEAPAAAEAGAWRRAEAP